MWGIGGVESVSADILRNSWVEQGLKYAKVVA